MPRSRLTSNLPRRRSVPQSLGSGASGGGSEGGRMVASRQRDRETKTELEREKESRKRPLFGLGCSHGRSEKQVDVKSAAAKVHFSLTYCINQRNQKVNFSTKSSFYCLLLLIQTIDWPFCGGVNCLKHVNSYILMYCDGWSEKQVDVKSAAAKARSNLTQCTA